jgi:hypothetical protein
MLRSSSIRGTRKFCRNSGDLPADVAHWAETFPVCKFFQGDSFFIPARSFLPTRWALGYLRAAFASLRQALGGQPMTTGRNF